MGTKEPGTVRWLQNTLKPDDIVLDVGANVGIYSVFAAGRLEHGQVFAIEPHAGSFAILLKSIYFNRMQDRITPLNIALDSASGWIDFIYNDLMAGSSGSRLITSPEINKDSHLVTEKKKAQSIDNLIESGVIPPPDIIKIDVDGNELNILRGMSVLLNSGKLRSIQVEADPSLEAQVVEYLAGFEYTVVEKHLSASGSRHVAKYGTEIPYPYNYIFEKKSNR